MNESLQQITEETLRKGADFILANGDGLRKDLLTTTGLTGINLEAPAKQLVPLLSPLRQSIGRTVRDGATASQWKAITGLSAPKLTTTETNPANAFVTTVVSKSATYKILGLKGQVTLEAVAASKGFDPALAKETMNCLLLAMKLEDQYILGGNVTALAAPGAPTVTVVVGGGTLPANTYTVRIYALTLPAINRLTVAKPDDWDGTDANVAAKTIVGSPNTIAQLTGTDGVVSGSAETTAAASALNDRLRISWTAVPGAAGYAVSVGSAAGETNGRWQVIVTQTKITLTSFLSTNVPGAVTATSADANAYDGIIPQLLAAGSGAFISSLGDKLSQSGGEVVQLQEAFANIWDAAKIGRFRVLCGGSDARQLTKLSIAAGGGPVIQVGAGDPGRTNFTQGYRVGGFYNATTGDYCPLEVEPWLPGGTILILPLEIPYPDANQSAPFDMALGYEWQRWDYASTAVAGQARIYPFEVVMFGALRAVFTGGCGIIQNVFKG